MFDETLRDVIGEEAAALLDEEREALAGVVELAVRIAPGSDAARNAAMVLEHLDEFFLLVVIGEVKSGKSSFVNGLLGEVVQAEGPLPLTDRIWVLKHGEERAERVVDEFVHELRLENDVLKLFHVVDTPGTNSIVHEHQRITESFIPKADLAIFVTSIDRPFSESERQFLEFVSARWRRKVLFVLTKIDAREPDDVAPVVEYIRENCRRFFGFDPRVFPLSAKRAAEAVASGDAEALAASGLPTLIDFLRSSMAEEERVRLKITGPADAALAILDELDATRQARRDALAADFRALTDLDAQLRQGVVDLRERGELFVREIEQEVREFDARARTSFESTLRSGNMNPLRSVKRHEQRFDAEVLGDLRSRAEAIGRRAVDWLERELGARFERGARHLEERVDLEQYEMRVAGSAPGEVSLDYRRERVEGSIQRAFVDAFERFDEEDAPGRVIESTRAAIWKQYGLLFMAAVLVFGAATASTSPAVLAIALSVAAVVLVGSFLIVPHRRGSAVDWFSGRVEELGRELGRALRRAMDDDIERSTSRLLGAYEPYLTFYRAETRAIEDDGAEIKEIRVRLASIIQAAGELSSMSNTEGRARPAPAHRRSDDGDD